MRQLGRLLRIAGWIRNKHDIHYTFIPMLNGVHKYGDDFIHTSIQRHYYNVLLYTKHTGRCSESILNGEWPLMMDEARETALW